MAQNPLRGGGGNDGDDGEAAGGGSADPDEPLRGPDGETTDPRPDDGGGSNGDSGTTGGSGGGSTSRDPLRGPDGDTADAEPSDSQQQQQSEPRQRRRDSGGTSQRGAPLRGPEGRTTGGRPDNRRRRQRDGRAQQPRDQRDPQPDTSDPEPRGYSGDPNPEGGIGEDVPARARSEAVELRQEAADQWQGAVGPEDIFVAFDEEYGRLEARLTESGRRELVGRDLGVESSEVDIQQTQPVEPPDDAFPGPGTQEPSQNVTLSSQARTEIAARQTEYSEDELTVRNGEVELTDEALREQAAEEWDVGTDDVEIEDGDPRLTDEGFREYVAETNEDVAGIGTVEIVETESGDRGYRIDDPTRDNSGVIGEVTADTPVGDVFETAGDAFEPAAEGAAWAITRPGRGATVALEAAGAEGVAQEYRDVLESGEQGLAEGLNVPRAGEDLVAVGEGIAYASGIPEGAPGGWLDPRDAAERWQTIGEAGQEVGEAAVQQARENPWQTVGAVTGGAAVGVGATGAIRGGTRGVTRGAARGADASDTRRMSRTRDAVSDARERAPVEVVRDPDAPMVEVMPEARQALRNAPTAPVRAARRGVQRGRLATRRLRRDFSFADAEMALRVNIGQVTDRAALAARRARRDASDFDPVTDARGTALIARDRFRTGLEEAPSAVAQRVRQGSQRIGQEYERGLLEMELGAASRRARARSLLDDTRTGARDRFETVGDRLGDAREYAASQADLPETSPLQGEISPTTFNARYFESDRPRFDPDGVIGSQRGGDLTPVDLVPSREALPSFSRPSMSRIDPRQYSVRVGSRPPRQPAYDLGELDEGALVEFDLGDADRVDVTPRSQPARRFREGTDAGEARGGVTQTQAAPAQQAVQLRRVETDFDDAIETTGRRFDAGDVRTGAAIGAATAQTPGVDLEEATAPALDVGQAAAAEVTTGQEELAAQRYELPAIGLETGIGETPTTTTTTTTTQVPNLDLTSDMSTYTNTFRTRVPTPVLPLPDADTADDFGGGAGDVSDEWVNPIADLGSGAFLFGGDDEWQ